MRIVLTGGGTGGHITPLLSLARALKRTEADCHITYIGLKGGRLESLLRDTPFDEIRYVSSGKFRRYHGESLLSHLIDIPTLLLNIRDFFKVLLGILQSMKLIRQLKPAVVFSKGGFVAVPVGIAAHWRGIPIVTHDSDSVPGLANRIIGRWASIQTIGIPNKDPRFRYVGIPLDEHIETVDSRLQGQYKKQLGWPAEAPVLLVMGGGMGSKSLNERLAAVAPRLLGSTSDLRLIHITGPQYEAELRHQYQKILDKSQLERLKVEGFSNQLNVYSGAADLVVCRAGASTLAELALEGKASLVIPAPFLAAGHQMKNAKWLADNQAALVLDDTSDAEVLYKAITDLLGNDAERQRLAGAIKRLAYPRSAQELSAIILDAADDHKKWANGRS